MNFFCYICFKTFQTVENVILHLKYQEFIKENPKTKIRCVRNKNCENTFQSYYSLKKHVKKHDEKIDLQSNELSNTDCFRKPNDIDSVIYKKKIVTALIKVMIT